MNKLELIKELREEAGTGKTEAETLVDLFFGEISNALAQGERVEIRGLCTFHVKEYKAYSGRNQKTGEKISVREKKLPFFRPGKELKKRVDRKK